MTTYQRLAPLALVLALAPRALAQAQAPAPAPAQAAAAAPSPDEQAVRALVAEFVRAFNAGDAAAVAATFADDAQVLNDENEEPPLVGRDAILSQFKSLFANGPVGTLAVESQSIRLLGPNTALEQGSTRLTPLPTSSSTPAEVSRYTALHVKRDGKWLQFLVRDTAIEPATPREHLEPIAWLVGDWVDESDQAIVHTSCHWADGNAYLLRDITAQVAGRTAVTASQRIGWDPLHKSIKSWVFDSEGGHSEALWSRDGDNRWLIKSTGVTVDGTPVTATHILTRINDSTATWTSTNRTRADQAEPDLSPITMVRRPPPAATLAP
jgi:uncharacterized protein (TIGR02246 family)